MRRRHKVFSELAKNRSSVRLVCAFVAWATAVLGFVTATLAASAVDGGLLETGKAVEAELISDRPHEYRFRLEADNTHESR